MNIGIVVYSQTGNTLAVAQKLKEVLAKSGHAATVEQVTITGEAPPRTKTVQLNEIPDAAPYDALVFGSPVHAFALSPAMEAYLQQAPSLQDKTIACFVTKQLPFGWTGGKQALGKMKQLCEARGAKVSTTEIIFWSKGRREQSINRCLDRLDTCFKDHAV